MHRAATTVLQSQPVCASCKHLWHLQRVLPLHCISVSQRGRMAGGEVVPEDAWHPPPLDSNGATFASPAWAASFARELKEQSARAVRVLSPCVGLNAPERAAREMAVPWESAGDYDINLHLADVLARLARNPNQLHVGRHSRP